MPKTKKQNKNKNKKRTTKLHFAEQIYLNYTKQHNFARHLHFPRAKLKIYARHSILDPLSANTFITYCLDEPEIFEDRVHCNTSY